LQLHYSQEIHAALAEKRAVVALESTLITHGLPYPTNMETALAMENAVRAAGALPATIAILAGKVHVGISAEQVDYLAQRPSGSVRKCSRRDLAVALAKSEDGATTVAGTMIVAHMAGIPVFATGGIGGVHRGQPFDVSADLLELGRTPVAVVCSGAKSILDLPLTMEVLETQGVPVIGYQTDMLPSFYTRSSGIPLQAHVDTPSQAASVIRQQQALGLSTGMLFTVPVPAAEELSGDIAEAAIEQATAEAEAAGIHGARITPFVLDRVAQLTEGVSRRANTALLINNARTAGEIALALTQLH
jgi:pseudouridine-5'-phosphate glycosidase